MKKRYYFLTAILSYLLLLTATIPANMVSGLVNDRTPLIMQGVSGTLWNGSAYLVSVSDSIQLKNTRWSFKLWRLLLGQLAIDLQTQFADNNINAELGSSFTGRLFINDLNARLPAKVIAEQASIPLARLGGTVSLNIENAQWKQGELPTASGQINWTNATITVAETASLGNVSITLGESEQQLLKADIKNQGGDIRLSGFAELIPEANYMVNIKLVPTATASDSVEQSLGLFASKQGSGEYLLKNTGSLNQIGLI